MTEQPAAERLDPIEKARRLHEPHMSVPLDICTGVPWEPESVECREATVEEKAERMRWWCDECRTDAPCRTYQLLSLVPTPPPTLVLEQEMVDDLWRCIPDDDPADYEQGIKDALNALCYREWPSRLGHAE